MEQFESKTQLNKIKAHLKAVKSTPGFNFKFAFYHKMSRVLKIKCIIGNLHERHTHPKYIKNEDSNIIRVHSMNIVLLIFLCDIIFFVCLLRDVLRFYQRFCI